MPATVPGSARYWKGKWLGLVDTVPGCHSILSPSQEMTQGLKACLGYVELSVIRPVETTQYFFERFALIKDLLYGKNSLHRPLVQN